MESLLEVYRPLFLPILGVLGFIASAQVINLIPPYIHSKIIDGLVSHQPIDTLQTLALTAFVIWVFRVTVFRIFRERYELNYVDGAIPERMQEYTMKKLFGFSIGQHTSENSGIKQSVINRGENGLQNMIQLLIYQGLPVVIEMLIMSGVLLYMAPIIGAVVLTCVVINLTFIWKLNMSFRKDFKEVERRYIQDSKLEGEVVRNIALVMVNAQNERAIQECRESQNGAFEYNKLVWLRFLNWTSIRDSIPQIARLGVYLLGIKAVLSGQYTVGQLTMYISWAGTSLGNLGDLSSLHRQIIRAYNSIRGYFDMLAIEPDVKVVDNPIRPEKYPGRIEFKNVTFKYPGRDSKKLMDDENEEVQDKPKEVGPALDNVSFIIEAGQTVAFVGESGAGKSTLVNALIRAQDPAHGQILVDGNDLRLLDLKHFRQAIGFVNQDVTLFDRTLEYNITYGLEEERRRLITDIELRDVAEHARIDRFFDRLEKGFKTNIGERGVKLSGGERQRVGIARALIKNPDILIFDEATSNLDSANEDMIRDAIEGASRGRTTIIIAHRFSTIRKVDKVFVFDKGKLVGQGSHSELSETCEHYQRLVRNQ
ncbi:MAG TPA: ABC transporter ATP-binding protein [Parcubacteria group bacterium]|nr:ABC transporter ATP-binding protein [Parcubacteria group bacterium]